VTQAIAEFEPAFAAALDDNLDLPGALVHVHAFITALNRVDFDPASAAHAQAAVERMDEILCVLERRVRAGVLTATELGAWLDPDFLRRRALALAEWRAVPERAPLLGALERGELPDALALGPETPLDQPLTELLLGSRHAAKKQRQFERADALRGRLKELGASIEDLPGGNVRWKLDLG
jgi:cysteinyl-tRNA synthetase